MLVKCPECSHEVSDTATSCPNCGFTFTADSMALAVTNAQQAVADASRQAEQRRQAAQRSTLTNIAIGGALCLVFLLVVWIFSNKSPSAPRDTCNDRISAITMAEQFVEKSLKAPRTAEFCKIREFQTNKSNGNWTVSGHVDSQNSFGAMVRTQFTVEMSCNGETWRLLDMRTN